MGTRVVRQKAPLEVDRDSLLELARGGNLYQSRFACLRELVQNAADATLLRVFAEHGARAFPTHEGSLRDLRTRLRELPIQVSVTRLSDEGAMRRYRIVVEDHGTGIARADVPHLQRIASSRKNPRRVKAIAAMPEWMRPSGTFGIGLQSAFLLTDTVTIETRSLDDEQHTVVLRARDGGTIELREGCRPRIGTRVELIAHVPTSAVSERGRREDGPDPDPLEGSLDPILEAAHGVVRHAARASLVPVVVDGALIASSFECAGAWFDPSLLVEIALPTDDGPGVAAHDQARSVFDAEAHLAQRVRAHYRGAPVDDNGTDLLVGVRLSYSVHARSARELLLVGRDTWSKDGHRDARGRVWKALQRRGPHLLDHASADARSVRAWLSVHVLRACRIDLDAGWRDIALSCDGPKSITLGRAYELGAWIGERRERSLDSRPWDTSIVRLPDGTTGKEIPYHLYPLLDDLFPAVDYGAARTTTHRLVGDDHVSWAFFENQVTEESHSWAKRPLLMIPAELEALSVPTAANQEIAAAIRSRRERRREMLSPWTFTKDVVDVPHVLAWIAWTARRGAVPRNRAVVAETLVALLRRMDAPLRRSRWRKIAYDLDSVIAEIERVYAKRPTSERRSSSATKKRPSSSTTPKKRTRL
ncbi:MAG: ATP-binding protein [Deltaproteobacteria bacterium]|nr:ATP-binding protein [Deltaproteobacteria bacterium]